MKNLFSILIAAFFINPSIAQPDLKLDDQFNIVFGVGQILAGGFNAEINLSHNRLMFDYSHGMNLKSPNSFLEEGADKDQFLSVNIPWTTGFGVGYRFNDWLNLRAEPKLHKFEIYYDNQDFNSSDLIVDYTTFTLGLGLYANFRPFKNQGNFLKGLMISPNVRWWPNVWTSLDDNSFEYFNSQNQQLSTHNARNIGMANTPFFFNVSIGYSFGI